MNEEGKSEEKRVQHNLSSMPPFREYTHFPDLKGEQILTRTNVLLMWVTDERGLQAGLDDVDVQGLPDSHEPHDVEVEARLVEQPRQRAHRLLLHHHYLAVQRSCFLLLRSRSMRPALSPGPYREGPLPEPRPVLGVRIHGLAVAENSACKWRGCQRSLSLLGVRDGYLSLTSHPFNFHPSHPRCKQAAATVSNRVPVGPTVGTNEFMP